MGEKKQHQMVSVKITSQRPVYVNNVKRQAGDVVELRKSLADRLLGKGRAEKVTKSAAGAAG